MRKSLSRAAGGPAKRSSWPSSTSTAAPPRITRSPVTRTATVPPRSTPAGRPVRPSPAPPASTGPGSSGPNRSPGPPPPPTAGRRPGHEVELRLVGPGRHDHPAGLDLRHLAHVRGQRAGPPPRRRARPACPSGCGRRTPGRPRGRTPPRPGPARPPPARPGSPSPPGRRALYSVKTPLWVWKRITFAAGTRPVAHRTWADASVACPHSSTSTVGVNQRRSQSPSGRGRMKAVSAWFISLAAACIQAARGPASGRQTAAGLPANGRSVNASTRYRGTLIRLLYTAAGAAGTCVSLPSRLPL